MIKIEFKRYEGETDEELIYRICSQKDQIGTWVDVANILNELTGNEYTESKYRKTYQAFIKLLNANQKIFSSTESQVNELRDLKRDLEKERKKLQTEKIEYNKWLREDARDELIAEKIYDAISTLPSVDIPKYIQPKHNNKSWVLCLADAHYGVEYSISDFYGETLNEYSPEIFEERMSFLFDQVVEKITTLGIDELTIFELGDGIDGMLRLTSQLMKLRYGVLESSIRYANYLANWINNLSRYTRVKFHMVMDSNHNQLRLLSAPKNAFPDENMSKVMITLIKERLKDNPNVVIVENPTGMNYAMMSTYCIVGLHGEKKDLKKNLLEMSHLYGIHIDYTISAHMHHKTNKEVGFDSEVLSVGSIIGVDGYSMSLNATSNASATMFEFEQGMGRTAEYLFKLN